MIRAKVNILNMRVINKYSGNISCPMSNYNLTFLAIFGVLLIGTVAASSLLLFPVAKIVSATTATSSGENETAATATTVLTSASGSSGNNITEATFLFIQSAQSGSLSEVNATTSTLELNDVSNKTIVFSDRPDRIISSIDTADFIGNWSTGVNNFAIDAPNVALVVDDKAEQKQDLGVIELFNPVYDSEANTLRYNIVSENGTSFGGLPGQFGQSTLVIDSNCDGHFNIPPFGC
ncbi:MAG: hypothetical protein P0116_15655 [Candidatus Nitrosocosmicus sp.]|nr:hypothetical protein [Candidatus Nitrosocosmicus sp.]